MSAITPPRSGPINVPVTLPVCRVPRTFPAVSFGVCVGISACDIGAEPVNTPEIKRNKKSWHTEVAYPINRTEIDSPVADKIHLFLRPYLSPILPHTGEKRNAVTKVIAKLHPDQFCTYSAEKFPKVSMYSEINGITIVMLPATKKLANHMIITLRLIAGVS